MWRTVKLGDVVSYTKSNAEGSRLPYVGMENIASETLELIGDIHVPESTSTTFEFNESHVLFGRLRPYLRKVLIPSFRGQCSTEIFCLKPSCELLREYLAYWLLEPTVSKQIVSTSTGARMPRANMNKLLEFEFVLPPLAEQQRIVAKLDAAFAEIESSIKLVETKQANAEKLKASLLNASLRGDAEMWTQGCIGDVLAVIQNGVNCKQDKSGVGQKITRIETIAASTINYNRTGFSELDSKQIAKAKLEAGDILFSHINSPIHVGKSAVYDGKEALYHGINLLRMRPIEAVDSSYFNLFLNSLYHSGYWKRTSKQSVNQASVNQTDIKSVPFSFPPLAEQQRIVAKLDAAFGEIDTAKSAVASQRSNYSALKSAILAQELQPPQSEAA